LTFVDSLKRTASLRNNVRSALIAYFDYVTTTGRRTDNPAKAILRWREPKRLPKPIERTQATRLIAQAFVYRPIFGCLVVLYLNTGLRLSELCQRRWSDLVGNRLFLVKKGGDERCVFLNSAAMQALNEWRAQCSSPLWMFPSPRSNERPISRHWVYDKIRDLGVIAGIDGCRPHRLRHTFGTELYRQTHDLLLVKEALGHEDVRNTVIYTRVAIGIQEALEKLHY
jgi:integrase